MLVPGAGKWRHRSAFGCRTPAFGVNPLGTPVKGAFGRSRSHHREQTWRVQEHTAGGFPRTGAGGRRTPGPAPRNRRPPERDRRRNGRDTGGGPPRTVRPPGRPATQWQTTSVLTAAMLVYALGAGITAAAGTRLALQLLLVKGFKLYSFQLHYQFNDKVLLLVVTTSMYYQWVICAPAAFLGSTGRFSIGPFSGIEP